MPDSVLDYDDTVMNKTNVRVYHHMSLPSREGDKQ